MTQNLKKSSTILKNINSSLLKLKHLKHKDDFYHFLYLLK